MGRIIPYIMEHKIHVPNHQPVFYIGLIPLSNENMCQRLKAMRVVLRMLTLQGLGHPKSRTSRTSRNGTPTWKVYFMDHPLKMLKHHVNHHP
jgi:hypothetical protein